jgi:hypothetical protein
MQIIPLTTLESANMGFTHKVVLTFADINLLTSATAASVYPTFNTATTFAAGLYVRDAASRVVTAFTSSGGAITSLTFSIGDGNSGTAYINAQDLKTTGFTAGFNATKPAIYSAADTLDVTATISGQTMASLNAGEVHLYLALTDLSRLDK